MSTLRCISTSIFIFLCYVAVSEQSIIDQPIIKNISEKVVDIIDYNWNKLENKIERDIRQLSSSIMGPIHDMFDPEWIKKINYAEWIAEMKHSLEGGMAEMWINKISSSFDVDKVLEEIKTSTYSKATCVGCKFLVNLGRYMMNSGKSDDEILNLVSTVCSLLKIQKERVCAGTMDSIGRDALEAIKGSPMTPSQICSFHLAESCENGYDERHDWKQALPTSQKPAQHPPTQTLRNTRMLKVVQITDTHYDPHYLEGSNVDCGEPLCCRADSGQPASASVTAGKWGDYRRCDTPTVLFENALKHIVDTHKDIDYVIWTGDAPPHDVWNQTKEDNLWNMKFSAQLIAKYFKGIQIYPSIGNHESCPVDGFGGDAAPQKKSMSWLYDELDREWSRWLPASTSPTIRHHASYSVLVRPGFRILSVNGNYCGRTNFWMLRNSTDPAGILAWLVSELDKAEANGEKVHIIGHVPPGGVDCIKVWSKNYYDIINRYEGIIMAQFFGHTHNDEFEVFYDNNDLKRALGIGYVSPSITPWENVNPAYRIYYVEGDHPESTRAIVDHETWKMDVDEANRSGEPVWFKAYSAREAYNMSSLHPSEWSNLINRMIDDKDLFEIYHKNYYRDTAIRPKCDDACRRRMLCDLRSGRSHDRKNLCYGIY